MNLIHIFHKINFLYIFIQRWLLYTFGVWVWLYVEFYKSSREGEHLQKYVLDFTKYALDYNIEDINTDMHHICIYRYAPISKIHASIFSNKCLIYSIHPREHPFIEETTAWI